MPHEDSPFTPKLPEAEAKSFVVEQLKDLYAEGILRLLVVSLALTVCSCGGSDQLPPTDRQVLSSPSITTSNLPNGVEKLSYQATLKVQGGTPPYTWTVSQGVLPAGLTLDSQTGEISGTPIRSSDFQFDIQVQDSAGKNDSSTFSVIIGRPTAPNLKVAFIGDQGLGPDSEAVLQLIANEGAQIVLHQGDFDYSDDPEAWDSQINKILGASFPYFASIGNHDVAAWSGYQQKLEARLAKIPEASCTGDLGVQAACSYRGLFFLLTSPGTMGENHDIFIRNELAADHAVWSVCSWHKNQQEMQVGGKTSEVGWESYEECRKGGAIIATAHEHSYHRTRTLISTQDQTVDPDSPEPDKLQVDEGSTFVFVSGLGGRSIRDQKRCLPGTFPYGCNQEWANIYTSTQGAKFGVLFITFNVDGDPREAIGEFKNVEGVTIDTFTIQSGLP
ncbi:putative Ig domain-containing protein [Acidobacteriia bacterium AH_259_A11_L15]|nr:putative Ig domain-containing protein [Acidobacteriia bacterium AH_259_A11_L15]